MFRIITVAAAASALTLGSLACAAPALASVTDGSPTPTAHSSLSDIQQAGAAATAKRITSLTTRIGTVNSSTRLSSADKSTVLGTLNADLTAMHSLQTKIAADASAATAWTDYRSIFTDYRVYAVAIRQSYIAAVADGLTGTAIPKLQSAEQRISTYFAAHPDKVTSDLQAKLADMQAKTADAASKTAGLAAAALAVTPAAFNANHAVLTDDRAAARAALDDTKAAAQDGRAIMAALK
ncbi:MAG TPA: hypothetical protein VFQ74_04660 [Pseudolysinimonas sp.]|nr:hypothetical protein [Pseudolysinimonas sp.]